MVRLKDMSVEELIKMAEEFQFQNGAIKSIYSGFEKYIATEFQFQNGAIKRTDMNLNNKNVVQVSIPKWCD